MKKLVVFILFGSVLLVPAFQSAVHAQPETDDTAARCQISQNFIAGTLRPRDLRARVDRLQAYQYIYGRLDILVQRLEHNNQPLAGDLRSSLNTLNSQINSFKTDYEGYDQARQTVINQKKCADNATVFQQKLEVTRVSRRQVNDDVNTLQTQLDSVIRGQLDNLRQQLLATGQTGVSE